MRKKLIWFIIMLVLSILFFVTAAAGEPADRGISAGGGQLLLTFEKTSPGQAEAPAVSVLPESLLVIEEGAFEGTALGSVTVPGSVVSIEDRAFAEISGLRKVILPDSLRKIAGNPFAGSEDVILSGFSNSFVQGWSRSRGFRYFRETGISAWNGRLPAVAMVYSRNSFAETAAKSREETAPDRNVTRTGRNSGEVKADLYRGVGALYIQSRYFP